MNEPINAKPKRPNEIPIPGKNPETIPAEEPEPMSGRRKIRSIQPEKESLTVPPPAPPEIPKRPENTEPRPYYWTNSAHANMENNSR